MTQYLAMTDDLYRGLQERARRLETEAADLVECLLAVQLWEEHNGPCKPNTGDLVMANWYKYLEGLRSRGGMQ